MTDTIHAASSAPGAAPRAVVRLSGPRAFELAAALFAPLPARGARRTDGALSLPGWPDAPAAAWTFRSPKSYTGEDVVELVVPGSPPLVRALLAALAARGSRLARPGELTRRAFHAGRLDLTRAEAILALTTCEDEREARSALRALEGGLAARIDTAKQALLAVLAHLEAAIDFSEEELALRSAALLAHDLRRVASDLAGLSRGAGPRAGVAPRVVLRGPANAGKSALFNALVGRDAALVSPRAGTTRDVLEARWPLRSLEARLFDTAGDLTCPEPLERRALGAAESAAAAADLVLYCLDGAATGREGYEACPGPKLLVLTKRDLAPHGAWPEPADLQVSALTGAGLGELSAAVEAALHSGPAPQGQDLVASVRQEELLRTARLALERAAIALERSDPARAELAALELREALDALGALTGEVTTDALLDVVFGQFCVGK